MLTYVSKREAGKPVVEVHTKKAMISGNLWSKQMVCSAFNLFKRSMKTSNQV